MSAQHSQPFEELERLEFEMRRAIAAMPQRQPHRTLAVHFQPILRQQGPRRRTDTTAQARAYAEGKKMGWRDGVRAVWCILKYRRRRSAAMKAVEPGKVKRSVLES